MVELTCDACGTTNEFPATLEVVDEQVDGWELSVTAEDEKLIVTSATCTDCQAEVEHKRDEEIRSTIKAARKYMSVEPTPRDIQEMCEYDVSIARVEELMNEL